MTPWPLRVAPTRGRGPRRSDVAFCVRRPDVAVGVAGLALAAPAVFVAGLLAAQAAHPDPDVARRSLSALAGGSTASAWILTSTLALVGVLCASVALGLRTTPAAARAVLAGAGAMLVLAAAAPQPPGGTSVLHMLAAGLAWAGFVAWPLVLACSRGVDHRLRWTSAAAGCVLVVLAAWFAVQLLGDGPWYGASQRILVIALAVWPARVALAAVRPAGVARIDLPRVGSPGR